MALQPMYLVLWLLNFHFVTGLRHIEDAELEKIELEENHSNTAAFQFSVINNSSLPLNFLALPKLAQIYAHTKNRAIPGEKFAFLAALGAYDLHVTVQDGRNDWYQASETTWGLTKEGISLSIQIATGAGVTGTLAVTATAAVTASLTAVAAAPLAITLAATATFWGVAVFSSMACSFLTEVSVNFLRAQLEAVEQESDGMERLHAELAEKNLSLVDLTHRFEKGKHRAVFENAVEYLCCCTKPAKQPVMVCELVPADSPSKYWFRSGCPGILGDAYHSFEETLKLDTFGSTAHRGRCVVPKSPFAQLTTGPERLVAFDKVVRPTAVVEAFQQSFPSVKLEYTVMSLSTAEMYFTAMQSKFSEWKVVKGGERKFVIAGGFINPNRLPIASDEEPWTVIDFLPLQMGEIEPTHGCQVNDDLEFWRMKEKSCQDSCKRLGGGPACQRSCVDPFRPALDQEVQRAQEMKRLEQLKGEVVKILDKETFKEAAAVAMVPFSKTMESFVGASGKILKLDLHFLTADVEFPMKTVVKFPLEALEAFGAQTSNFGEPRVFSSSLREALSSSRFGQCWSSCSASGFWNSALSGLKVAATLGSTGAWCYTTPKKSVNHLEVGGSICLEDDDCQSLADEWTCADECA